MSLQVIVQRAETLREGFSLLPRETRIDLVLELKRQLDWYMPPNQQHWTPAQQETALAAWETFLSVIAPLVRLIPPSADPPPPVHVWMPVKQRHGRRSRK